MIMTRSQSRKTARKFAASEQVQQRRQQLNRLGRSWTFEDVTIQFQKGSGVSGKGLKKKKLIALREIKLHPVERPAEERYSTLTVKNQFVSLVSPNNYFHLSGSNDKGTCLVYMSREPHLIANSHYVNDQSIVLSKNSPVINNREVLLAYCPEKLEAVTAVTVDLQIKRDAIPEGNVKTDEFEDFLLNALEEVPIKAGKEYNITPPCVLCSPTSETKSPGDIAEEYSLFRNYFLGSGGERSALCPMQIMFKPAASDHDVSHFTINYQTEILWLGDISIKKIDEEARYHSRLNDIRVLEKTSRFIDNFAYVCSVIYGMIKIDHATPYAGYAGVPLPLCKIGGFHYFCLPRDGEEFSNTIEINSLYFDELKKEMHTLEPCKDYAFRAARECQVELDWYKLPQTIELSSQQIVNKVKMSLCQVPLEQDKKFLISLSNDDEKPIPVQGKIIAIKKVEESKKTADAVFTSEGDSADNSAATPPVKKRKIAGSSKLKEILTIGDSTKLYLTAKDTVLLDGGIVEDRKKERIIEGLTNRLAGMDDIALQIYEKIIEPLILYKDGKVDVFERGLLLTGPPGNGKTQIATNIIQVLEDEIAARNRKIDSSYQGSPNLVKEKFDSLRYAVDAMKRDARDKTNIMVVFIDELDSYVPTVLEKSVSDEKTAFATALQLLISNGPENMLFIATTNCTKDAFHGQLVRYGRLGQHVSVCNPDDEQREVIFKHIIKTRGYSCKKLNLLEMANRTRGVETSTLVHITDEIIKAAVLRGIKKGGELSDMDFEKTQFNLEKAKNMYRFALTKISDKARKQPLLASEEESFGKALAAINRVRGNMGKHIVVLLKVNPERAETFCYHLFKSAGSYLESRSENSENSEKLRPFTRFHMVDSDHDMTIKALAAMGAIESAERTLLIINGVDLMASEECLFDKKRVLGSAWKKIAVANTQCVAMVLLYNDVACGVSEVKEAMGLDWITESVVVQSIIKEEDYKNIIEKYNCPDEMKTKLLDVMHGCSIDIGRFQELLNIYSFTDETGKTSLNVEMIGNSIKLNQKQEYEMYM